MAGYSLAETRALATEDEAGAAVVSVAEDRGRQAAARGTKALRNLRHDTSLQRQGPTGARSTHGHPEDEKHLP